MNDSPMVLKGWTTKNEMEDRKRFGVLVACSETKALELVSERPGGSSASGDKIFPVLVLRLSPKGEIPTELVTQMASAVQQEIITTVAPGHSFSIAASERIARAALNSLLPNAVLPSLDSEDTRNG